MENNFEKLNDCHNDDNVDKKSTKKKMKIE